MTKMIKYTLLAILLLVLAFLAMLLLFVSSGNSNTIYFDIEQQAVVRCKGTISNLYIISKDNEDYFLILSEKKESNIFMIKELDKNYSIKTMTTPIGLQNFKLRPETEYEIINHSNGGAVDGKLLIKTDKNSSVIYADKTSCK